MSRSVKVSPSYTGGPVYLPNKRILHAGETSVLSDSEWALMSGTGLVSKGVLLDQGASAATPDSGGGSTGGGTGATGATGATGKSAYQSAVDGGFVGTEAAWLASLKGTKGDPGLKGDTGATGPAGTGALGLSASAPVPAGTPVGTMIFRTAT